MVEGVLHVLIPDTLSAEEEEEWVAEMQRRVVAKNSSRNVDLQQRADALADEHRLPRARSVRFSARQTRRWGSCTPETATVRIAERLAAYPPWVLDYVIVHELAHLAEANHSPEFWELVDRYPLAERARGFLIAMQTHAPDLGS